MMLVNKFNLINCDTTFSFEVEGPGTLTHNGFDGFSTIEISGSVWQNSNVVGDVIVDLSILSFGSSPMHQVLFLSHFFDFLISFTLKLEIDG